MAELRRDPVTGNWVVVGYRTAPGGPIDLCPFCPGNEHLTPKTIREYKDKDGSWLIRCFPATNPIFVIEADLNKRGEGIYDKMNNVGAHEVIIESRFHTKTMSDYTDRDFMLLLEMFQERILDLKNDKRFKYIQIFKNHGELAGSYIQHPHSHVLATPAIPQRIELELSHSKTHYRNKERCLFCDIISEETRQNKRVVSMNSSFISICPFASRFPFETWILPRFHADSFESLNNEGTKHELVSIFADVMKRIESLTNAYTIVMHSSPNIDEIDSHDEERIPVADHFHWHIEILPRDFKSSKYKREDEFYVVSTTPEDAAKALKEGKI
jgi:UDPglucose--hexose-1-phosphate uridylyltransferase